MRVVYSFPTPKTACQHGLFLINFTDQQDSENVSDNEISSSSSDSEESRVTEDNDVEEIAVVRLSWKPSGGPVCLGEWEQHTKVKINKLLHVMNFLAIKNL